MIFEFRSFATVSAWSPLLMSIRFSSNAALTAAAFSGSSPSRPAGRASAGQKLQKTAGYRRRVHSGAHWSLCTASGRGGVSLFAAAERHAAQGNVAVVEAGAQHAAFSTSNFSPARCILATVVAKSSQKASLAQSTQPTMARTAAVRRASRNSASPSPRSPSPRSPSPSSSPARKPAPKKLAAALEARARAAATAALPSALVALVALLLILAAVAASTLAQGRPLAARPERHGQLLVHAAGAPTSAAQRRGGGGLAAERGDDGAAGARAAPLPLADASSCKDCIALTAEELAEYDGRPIGDDADGERRPLFLAVLGRIYDVRRGRPSTGLGARTTSSWAATRAAPSARAAWTTCLIPSLDGLSDAQRAEAYKWAELYEHHDKYKLVGSLRVAAPVEGEADYTAEDLEQWEREEVDAALEAEGRKAWRKFRPEKIAG